MKESMKRLGAVMLSLCMLCGLLLSGVILPTSAEPTTHKAFEADFSDLAALVAAESYDANGLYKSAYTDKAVNNWVNTHFSIYSAYGAEPDMTKRLYLGQSSYNFYSEKAEKDEWGGAVNWLIDRTGYLKYNTTATNPGAHMRKSEQLQLKTFDGAPANLANFEATVTYRRDALTAGAVTLSFHENGGSRAVSGGSIELPGNVIYVGSWSGASERVAAVAQGSTPSDSVLDGAGLLSQRPIDGSYTAPSESALPLYYTMKVRVVNGAVTVTFYNDETGTNQVGQQTFNVTTESGTLSVGVGSSGRSLKSIKVVELDASGNAVDFGTATTEVEKFGATFDALMPFNDGTATGYKDVANAFDNGGIMSDYSNTAAKAERQYLLRQMFAEFTSVQGALYQNDFADETPTYNGASNEYAAYHGFGYGKYLRGRVWCYNADHPGKIAATIVPKSYVTGEMYKMTNFETEFKVRMKTWTNQWGVYLTFRQQTAGALNHTRAWDIYNRNQALVGITNYGITVGGGEALNMNDNTANVLTFGGDNYAHVDGTIYTIKVRAVGNDCKLKVTATPLSGQSVVVFDNFAGGAQEATVLSLGGYVKEGYVGYAIGGGKNAAAFDLESISLTRLDNEGDPIDIDVENNIGVDAADKEQFTFDASVGSYTGSAQLEDQPEALATIQSKFMHYYAHNDFYDDVAWYGNAGGTDASGNWSLANNKWLCRSDATGTKRLSQINALVPKDANNSPAKAKNLLAEFNVKFDDANTTFVFGFRQKNPARFINSADNVNQEQALVAINKEYISVKAGTGITTEEFHSEPATYETYATALGTTLPNEVHVRVKVVDDQVTVGLYDITGETPLYSKLFTVSYVENGYMALGVAAGNGSIGNVNILRLNLIGQPTDLSDAAALAQQDAQAPVFKFDLDDVVPLTTKYGHGNTSCALTDGSYPNDPVLTNDAKIINTYLDRKFAQYYCFQDTYKQMAFGEGSIDATLTQSVASYNNVWNGWLQRGMGNPAAYQMLHCGSSLVPRNEATGEELVLKNFETTYLFRWETTSMVNHAASLLQFRQTEPGKYSDNQFSLLKDQGIVALTPHGITVAAGNDIVSGAGIPNSENMWDNAAIKFETTLPQIVQVTVRLVEDKLWVTVCDQTGQQVLYNNDGNPFTINVDKEGYLAFGVTNRQASYSDITITRLDETGAPVDVNDNDENLNAPWNIYPNRYTQVMGSSKNDIINSLDYYYSSLQSGSTVVRKELMDAHWALDDNGVLYRQNDLNDNATSNVATMKWNLFGEKETLTGYDATFKLHLDETKNGTFWVVSGQTDAAKIGQVTATDGATDYLAGQVAVGFAVGGEITLATGDGTAVTIPATAMGTPTGTHNLRVLVANGNVEVYHNGALRVSRAIDASAYNDGYLYYGYSGAALGISETRVARVDEYGTTVDFETEYTAVQSVADVTVSLLDTAADIQLPSTLKVYKGAADEDSAVFWDLRDVQFGVSGEYLAVGYLEKTNGIRAHVKVTVGKHDPSNTLAYSFNDEKLLDDATSYFMPYTNEVDMDAVKTEGTADDNWFVANGRLQFKSNSMYNPNTSNMGVLVLDKDYENFMLDFDFKGSETASTYVGFGAKGTGVSDVFATQTDGGYALYNSFIYNGRSANYQLMGVQNGAINLSLAQHEFAGYDIYSGSLCYHVRLIVSEGKMTVYFGDNTIPFEYDLPAYDGGKIYFALEEASGYFDNIKIVDLDVKDLEFVSLNGVPGTVTINREAGENFAGLPQSIYGVTDEGYEYEFKAKWQSDTYRSYKDGTHYFRPVVNMPGVTFDPATTSVKVINNIGNDFDTTSSIKYYFDHENDLLDFNSYYSAPEADGSGYYTGENGYLVKHDSPTDSWKVTSNGVTAVSPVNPGNSQNGHIKQAQNVESMTLKEEMNLNLMNYKVEFDFRHANDNWWYPYVLFGVQDPSVFMGKPATLTEGQAINQLLTSTDSGCWIWVHQEGTFTCSGAFAAMGTGSSLGAYESFVFDDRWQSYLDTFYKLHRNEQHHLEVIVFDEMAFIKIDDMPEYFELYIKNGAAGGLSGFASCNNGLYIDNFQVTSIDKHTFNAITGDVGTVPFEDAQRGWGVDFEYWDSYNAYVPSKQDTEFDWGGYTDEETAE